MKVAFIREEFTKEQSRARVTLYSAITAEVEAATLAHCAGQGPALQCQPWRERPVEILDLKFGGVPISVWLGMAGII